MPIPIPGVSAVTTALSVAGLESTAFTFAGFAPTGKSDLAAFLDAAAARAETTVFFESPHRVEKTLTLAAEILPAERRVVVARELTKKFETVTALVAGELPTWLRAYPDRLRGEFVVVIAGAPDTSPAPGALIDARQLLKALLAELPPAKAAKVASKITGEDRDTLYALAESLKSGAR